MPALVAGVAAERLGTEWTAKVTEGHGLMHVRHPFVWRDPHEIAVAVRVGPEVERMVCRHEELVGALDVAVEQQHVANAVRHFVDGMADLRKERDPVREDVFRIHEELKAVFGGDHGALVGEVHATERSARVATAGAAVGIGEAGRVEAIDLEGRVGAVLIRNRAAKAAGGASTGVEGAFHDVAVAIGVDGARRHPGEVGAEVLVLLEAGSVNGDVAPRRLKARREARVIGGVAGGSIAAGEFEPRESPSRDDVGNAGHRLGPIGGGSAVPEDFHPFDQEHRQGIDVEEALPSVVGNRRKASATTVDERQGGRQSHAAQAELRHALEVVLLRGDVGPGVCREVRQDVHGLGSANRFEELRIERLYRCPTFMHDGALDERPNNDDLLNCRIEAGGAFGGLRRSRQCRDKGDEGADCRRRLAQRHDQVRSLIRIGQAYIHARFPAPCERE